MQLQFIFLLQYEEIARIIDSREELGSVILRNTSADDSVLEILAESLINSHTLKVSFVFSVYTVILYGLPNEASG